MKYAVHVAAIYIVLAQSPALMSDLGFKVFEKRYRKCLKHFCGKLVIFVLRPQFGTELSIGAPFIIVLAKREIEKERNK